MLAVQPRSAGNSFTMHYGHIEVFPRYRSFSQGIIDFSGRLVVQVDFAALAATFDREVLDERKLARTVYHMVNMGGFDGALTDVACLHFRFLRLSVHRVPDGL